MTIFERGTRQTAPVLISTIAVLMLGSSSRMAGAEDANQLCPPTAGPGISTEEMRADLHQTVIPAQHSDVLVGVDVLGRVAIAADFDRDGISDRIILYTAQERLQGPWSRYLTDAVISIQKGTVLVTSKADAFGLSAAVSVARPQALPSWVNEPILMSAGRELVQLFDTKGAVPIASLDHNVVATWPESLWMDLLAEQPVVALGGCTRECCEDGSCTSGGAASTSCSIGGCTGNPSSCSVSGCGGTTPNNFACCKCGIDGQGGDANCRCEGCTCGACP
jgi:hypothetical protein